MHLHTWVNQKCGVNHLCLLMAGDGPYIWWEGKGKLDLAILMFLTNTAKSQLIGL